MSVGEFNQPMPFVFTQLTRHFEMFDKIRIVKCLDPANQLLTFFLLDPRHCLHLWVDAQWKGRGICAQNAVLDRDLVGWQPLARPFDDFHLVGQQCLQLAGVIIG